MGPECIFDDDYNVYVFGCPVPAFETHVDASSCNVVSMMVASNRLKTKDQCPTTNEQEAQVEYDPVCPNTLDPH